jgi:hypothetical protein
MKTNFDPIERLNSLMQLKTYAENQIEELSERIIKFPKLEPEYEDMEESMIDYKIIYLDQSNAHEFKKNNLNLYQVNIDWKYSGKLTADDVHHDTQINEELKIIAANEFSAWISACNILGDHYSPAGENVWCDVEESTSIKITNTLGQYYLGTFHE